MHFQRFKAWFARHKKTILIILAVLAVGFSIYWLFVLLKSDDSVSRTDNQSSQVEEEEVVIYYSPLTGLETSEAKSNRPVTAVVIENSPEARPQSSLHKSGLVFEAIAEGGITRFVTFFQETRPDPVGPVRSMRPYFIDWILPFDASIAHVGGSAMAQAQIKSLGVKDLDQFWNPASYWRVNTRYAPHNVYTNFTKLDDLNNQKGFKSSDFTTWARKDGKPAATPKAKNITISPSSYLYQSSYIYNKKCNCYRRSMAGAKHLDAETGTQISPKVVIAINAPLSYNSITGRNVYNFVGKGNARVFQDGKVHNVTWKKNARDSQIKFILGNGNELKLVKGQVWITALSPNQKATYTK